MAQEIVGSNPTAHPKGVALPIWVASYEADLGIGPDRLVWVEKRARSSMDRALGFGPRGCGFESCRARQK